MAVQEEIPQWAKQKACDLLAGGQSEPGCGWRVAAHGEHPIVKAFARYIAAHEEPPVDPLLVEAREIASDHCKALTWSVAQEAIAQGYRDDGPEMRLTLRALRRGIELAKSGEA